jgi:hypothetical protein
MGAWDHGPFENDDALDFVQDVGADGAKAVEQALKAVTGTAGYLEAPEASRAIAAAAFVAAAAGHRHLLGVLADEVFDEHLDSEELLPLKSEARAALDRVLGSDSELVELWDEGEPSGLVAFKAIVDQIREGLR